MKATSMKQIEVLLDFLDGHRSLALGRVRGKEGSVLSQRLWRQCADNLNSELGGAIKSPQEWKKYYNQYKSRVKAKARAIKDGIKRTGGGPAESVELTPLEQRLLSILGGCSSPLPVRQNPLPSLNEDHNAKYSREETRHDHNYVETLFDEHVTIEPGDFYVHPLENSFENIEIENSLEANDNSRDSLMAEMKITGNPDALATARLQDGQTQQAERSRKEQAERLREEQTEKPREEQTERREEQTERPRREKAARPRKRRRLRSPSPKQMDAFQEAGRHLAVVEAEGVEVNRQLVCATNRQAAAIESFVAQFKRFVDLYALNNQPNATL